MRRHSPRVSPSCTRVFGPIAATMRDCRVGFDRTTAQFRATDVTQRLPLIDPLPALDRTGGLAAVRGGAFAIARAREPTVARGGEVTVARGAERVVFRGAARSGARAGTGLGFFSLARSTGAESGCATVPADWMATVSVATTGVDGACDESVKATDAVVSRAESANTATGAESVAATRAAVPGCASAIFLPNDSAFGWLVGSVSATNVRGAGLSVGDGLLFFASQAPIASEAKVRIPTPFQRYGPNGPMGERSGLVPHQRQLPRCSG